MKKSILLVVLFTISSTAYSQSFGGKFKSADKTWLGIDYSAAKFIGSEGFTQPDKIPDFASKWNRFVITEPDKYNLSKAFFSDNIDVNLEQVDARNERIDGLANVQENSYRLEHDDVEEIALSYDLSNIEGMGILLITESYDKNSEKGTYWLVIIDAVAKETVHMKKYVAKAGGFGFRNYWARSFYNALKLIEKDMKKTLR